MHSFLAFPSASKETDSVPMFLLSEEFQFSRFLHELHLCTVLQTKEKGTILFKTRAPDVGQNTQLFLLPDHYHFFPFKHISAAANVSSQYTMSNSQAIQGNGRRCASILYYRRWLTLWKKSPSSADSCRIILRNCMEGFSFVRWLSSKLVLIQINTGIYPANMLRDLGLRAQS